MSAMNIIVTIKLFESFAVYHIINEHEGIFIAKLKRKCMFISFSFPELIFLRKGDVWLSDCDNPEVELLLTNQIDLEVNKGKSDLQSTI
ncbi:MAG TPA: hypothetical protein VGC75_01735 [Candidatus Nitrosocosmicus sp.]